MKHLSLNNELTDSANLPCNPEVEIVHRLNFVLQTTHSWALLPKYVVVSIIAGTLFSWGQTSLIGWGTSCLCLGNFIISQSYLCLKSMRWSNALSIERRIFARWEFSRQFEIIRDYLVSCLRRKTADAVVSGFGQLNIKIKFTG